MRVDHLMYAKDYKAYKERFDKISPDCYDPNIRNFLTKVNLSDELVTIFSCEGHDDKPGWGEGYVMFGVRDRDHIYKLYEIITHLFRDDQHLVGLTMTTRINFLAKPNKHTGKQPWHAVWNLHWRRSGGMSRQKGWDLLEQAGNQFEEWLATQPK